MQIKYSKSRELRIINKDNSYGEKRTVTDCDKHPEMWIKYSTGDRIQTDMFENKNLFHKNIYRLHLNVFLTMN